MSRNYSHSTHQTLSATCQVGPSYLYTLITADDLGFLYCQKIELNTVGIFNYTHPIVGLAFGGNSRVEVDVWSFLPLSSTSMLAKTPVQFVLNSSKVINVQHPVTVTLHLDDFVTMGFWEGTNHARILFLGFSPANETYCESVLAKKTRLHW